MSRSSTTSRSAALLSLCASWLCTACEDPLIDPATLVGPRILGARVRVDSDPGVAEPRAGQQATIDWLVVSNRTEPMSATLLWCAALPTLLGAPRCAGAALGERRVTGEWGEPFSFELQLPLELRPGDAWLAWFGQCDAGDARFDAAESAFRCPDGADPLSAFYRGFVPGAVPNRNPSLGDDLILLGGEPWLPLERAPEPGASCLSASLPPLLGGAVALIELQLTGDDREALDDASGGYAARDRESLVYTHVSSRPGLDRALSSIDFDEDDERFTLPATFEAGEGVGPEGEAVAFYLIVRDERGGVDWLRRDACLLSP